MRRLKIIITIFAILFIISSCKTTSTINSSVDNDSNIDKATKVIDITQIDTSEANEYQKKLLRLIDILKTTHTCLTPNEFKYVDEKKFNELAGEIYYQLEKVMKNDDLDNFRYSYLASKLIALLNDGHTELIVSSKYSYLKNEPYIPIAMHWFENELYIINTLKGYEELKNKKVLKIGNIDVKTVKEEVNKFISSDNIHERNKFNGNMLCRGIILELLGFLNKDNTVTIEYLDNNQINTASLPLVSIKNDFNKLWENYLLYIGKNDITYCKNRKNVPIRYELLPEYNTMYVQLNTFNDKWKWDPIKEFKKLFIEIKQNEVDKLIIDLRNNMGGNEYIAFQLLSYIKNENENHLYTLIGYYKPSRYFYRRYDFEKYGFDEIITREENKLYIAQTDGNSHILNENERNGIINLPKFFIFNKYTDFYMAFPDEEMRFDGEVYVLTSSYTFSCGSLFTALIKDNGYGTVIGEPTGCSSFSHAGSDIIRLFNGKKTLFLSFYLSIRANKGARISEPDAVYPDVYIPTTFEDYLNGVDPCWEYLVENVFNKPEGK